MDYEEIESETIQLIGYDTYKKILELQFKEGPTHQYSPVDKAIFDNFKTADSYNDYYIDNIRDNNNFSRFYDKATEFANRMIMASV